MSITFKRCKYNKSLYEVYRNTKLYRCECKAILQSSIFDKNDKKYVILKLPDDFSEEVLKLENELIAWSCKTIKQPFSETICAKVPCRYGRVEIPIINRMNEKQNCHNLHKGTSVLVDISVSKAWISQNSCGIYWTINRIKCLGGVDISNNE